MGKQVYQYAGGWVLASERRFAYEEWNLIGEFSVSGSSLTGLRTYAWGLDLSGSRQGAGGVGGLLKVTEAGNSYLPIYDGNGNVLGMIKASDGSLAAAYEYDAFGRTLRESGPYTGNPVRYSSKYTDPETGEIYYGYRVYSPSLGRFLNRDPKAEAGGLNLYAWLGNNGVGQVDYLGLTLIEVCTEKPKFRCEETYYGYHCVSSFVKECQLVEAPTGGGNQPPSGGSNPGGGGNGTGNTPTTTQPPATTPQLPNQPVDPNHEADRRKRCEGFLAEMQRATQNKVAATNRADELSRYQTAVSQRFESDRRDVGFARTTLNTWSDISEFMVGAFAPANPGTLLVGMGFRTKGIVDSGGEGNYIGAVAGGTLSLTQVVLEYGAIAGERFASRASLVGASGALGVALYKNFSPYFDQNAQRQEVLGSIGLQVSQANVDASAWNGQETAFRDLYNQNHCGDFF